MSGITQSVRSKRFVAAKDQVTLMMETQTGERFTANVIDCSFTGLRVQPMNADPATGLEPFMSGMIIPESKLMWNQNEATLGRLLVRRVENAEAGQFLALSCIDTKLPLFGDLAKLFPKLAAGEESVFEYELSSKKFNLASFVDADYTHSDIFQKCRDYSILHKDQKKNPLWQYYGIRHKMKGSTVTIVLPKSKRKQEYTSFANYDYLGLSSHPELIKASTKATEEFGVSATATPPLSGNTHYHSELENRISQTLGVSGVVLFNSGFAANIGSLTATLGLSDIVVADLLSHASIHDGMAASSAKVRLFKHSDNKHLENLLEQIRARHAGALVVTEGLFSMDGDVPDLRGFVKTAKKHGARSFVDEVHSFGVIGVNGKGSCDRADILDQVDIIVGSLSKGFGAGGGFVAGSEDYCTWLRGFARTEIFSSAMTPGHAAAGLKAMDLAFSNTERREMLRENITSFLNGISELGYQAKSDPESPIVPIIIGNEEKLGKMNEVLIEQGVLVNTIVYPAVANDACRFRFTITANHTRSDIQLALNALRSAAKEIGFDFSSYFSEDQKVA